MKSIFTHITHKAIDFKKWDRCVSRSAWPSLFAYSFYLNAVSPGWEALIIGDYETVFPLTKKSKFGYGYLPHPPFTGQLGLFGEVNAAIETQLYEYLQNHFRLIEIELNSTHKGKFTGLSEKHTYLIDYSKSFSYNENSKRNIKKAKEKELLIEIIKDKSQLSLSKKWLDPFVRESLGIDAYGISRFHALLLSALEQNQLCTYVTKNKDGQILALAHFIFNKHTVVYLKGNNFDKKQNSGSMHLLMSRAIEDFKTKARYFDFSGGSLPGIGRFFKGLGGKPQNYPILRYNRLPGIIRLLKGEKKAKGQS